MRQSMKHSLFLLLICITVLTACATKKIKQENAGLEGKRWNLVSVDGKSAAHSESYIEFDSTSGKIHGKGGCNGFGGTYTSKTNTLKIEGIISTKMACDHLDIENSFFRILEKADRYTIDKGALQLYQGNSLLATLKAASL
ncbi:heat shock protein HslJ [Arcticibacter tournemirensis]|uniref:META domain-containing protein n=1 Tax=Arcticibacter tournemirensis TaxID=699437 RepID=A0A5M9GSC0_9SPHI|nr:META domain-containing protein [Arcticibacter tournemirensis]KAA8475704.1 META domain-containing protein [Arcticibacter tournemirensis]TQM52299.1 heat shock protein HslJ [Arcticibacter tournemirensis]